MKRATLYSVLLLVLASLLAGCGGSSSSHEVTLPQEYRISQIAYESGDRLEYSYDGKNLLVQKRFFLSDGSLQESDSYLYNEQKQLLSERRVGTLGLYHSSIDYHYGALLYEVNNLPVVVSSDGNFSFNGTVSNTKVEYHHSVNEEGKSIGLDSMVAMRQALGVPIEESTNFSYDMQGKIVVAGDTLFSYHSSGRLASKSNALSKTLYNYNEENRLIEEVSYKKLEDGSWSQEARGVYHYEVGQYNRDGFSPNYFDQGQYINSGIY